MSASMGLRCATLRLVGLVLTVSCGTARAQPAQGTEPRAKQSVEYQASAARELYPAGRVQFSTSGPGAVAAGVQCDPNGNIYLVRADSLQVIYSLPHSLHSLPITKLSLGSKNAVEFPIGSLSNYADYYRESFYVDPRGSVYGLVVTNHHPPGYEGPNWADSLVVKYNDDGTVESVVKLESPQGVHLLPYKLAVFLDGSFLVAGGLLSDKGRPTRPFTWIFGRGGRICRFSRATP